jgi:hypothetical protein
MFCYWPRTNISFRARKAEIPDKEKWAKYPVRILHYTGEHYETKKLKNVCCVKIKIFLSTGIVYIVLK